MADMGLSGGFAAGAGADALESVLKQAFLQQMERKRVAQDQQRIGLEAERNRQGAELQRAQLASLNEARQGAAKLQAQQGADKLSDDLRVGQEVSPETVKTLTAGDRGDLVKGPTLGSQNIGGNLLQGQLRMTANPGKGPTYLGTGAQQKKAEEDAAADRLIANPSTSGNIRGFLQVRSAVPGGAVPPELFHDRAAEEAQKKQDREDQARLVASLRPPPSTTGADNRAQQSYQYHATQLEKLRKPVEDNSQKIGDLNELLAQDTPQADALVAPKLLSVLVGGQGSGLRMNEAEISRIVGGRSQWENLRAAAQKWSLDPAAANSITPAQRAQIHALVSAASKKNADALAVLDDAGGSLATATDPMSHRQILNDTHKKLSSLSTGGGAASTPTAAPSTETPEQRIARLLKGG